MNGRFDNALGRHRKPHSSRGHGKPSGRHRKPQSSRGHGGANPGEIRLQGSNPPPPNAKTRRHGSYFNEYGLEQSRHQGDTRLHPPSSPDYGGDQNRVLSDRIFTDKLSFQTAQQKYEARMAREEERLEERQQAAVERIVAETRARADAMDAGRIPRKRKPLANADSRLNTGSSPAKKKAAAQPMLKAVAPEPTAAPIENAEEIKEMIEKMDTKRNRTLEAGVSSSCCSTSALCSVFIS